MRSSVNLLDMLRVRAETDPDAPAYVFLEDGESIAETLSYGELERSARAVGATLQREGNAGERVVLLNHSPAQLVCAFFGCVYAGAVAVPVAAGRGSRGLAHLRSVAADAAPRTLLVGAAGPPDGLEALEHLDTGTPLRCLDVAAARAGDPADWRPHSPASSALAFLQYTSGSTQAPRGVMVSHGNLLHNMGVIQRAFRLSERTVVLGWLPLFHDMGLIGITLETVFLGARCVLMTPMAFLQKPSRWLRAVSEHCATYSGGPNFAYDLCVEKVAPEERAGLDLSCWEIAFNGAEPVRGETMERFVRTFGPHGFRSSAFQPCYGLAEATLAVSVGRPAGANPLVRRFDAGALQAGTVVLCEDDGAQARSLVGCGIVPPGVEVEIVTPETGERCPEGEMGEVWVSGPTVAAGYWRREAVNAQTFQAQLAHGGERRFLRTGDLGFLHAGELFITGRCKDLIIIRGRNHYPQDVESAVEACAAAVRRGCVAAFALEWAGEERLAVVAEVQRTALQADLGAIVAAIRRAAAEQEDIVPCRVDLVQPGRVPKTTSGKIQRGECRRRMLAGELDPVITWIEADDPVTPHDAGDTQARVRAAVSAVLHVPQDALRDDLPLTAWGLDSLRAVTLRARLEAEVGVQIPLSALFGSITVGELASRATAAARDGGGAGPSGAPESTGGLSRGQMGLWLLHQHDPGGSALNTAVALRLRGSLERAAALRAFTVLLDRHPVLRTAYPVTNGSPAAAFGMEPELAWVDAGGWDADELDRALREAASAPFDLERGPLLRATFFRCGSAEHVLLLAAHHIVADFWSQVLVLTEFATLYGTETGETASLPPEPPAGYDAFVRWQAEFLAGAEGERQWGYWRERLAGTLPVLMLPTDRPRAGGRSHRGGSLDFTVDRKLADQLRALARAERATPYMLLLAAYAVLLWRCTGDDEIVLGSPVSGRTREVFSRTVGYCMNPVLVRCALADRTGFDGFLAQVRTRVLEALDNQDFPTHVLAERLGSARTALHAPLFQTMFVWNQIQDGAPEELASVLLPGAGGTCRLGSWTAEAIPLDRTSALMDVVLYLGEADGRLLGRIEYDADLFDETTIRRLLETFRALLASVAAEPRRALGEIPLLADADRRMVLDRWSRGPAAPAASVAVHRLIEVVAAGMPHHPAVIGEEHTLTYAALEERANRLARHLLDFGAGPEAPVAICLPRTPDLVVAMLAAWKAGAPYVPLDPRHPSERLIQVVRDARACVVVAALDTSGRVEEAEVPVVLVDRHADAIAARHASVPPVNVDPGSLAYVIYTSGSTGAPKGVAVPHGAVANFVAAATGAYSLGADDRVLQFASAAFDASVEEIFPILTRGGAVVLRPEWVLDSYGALFRFCAQAGVTVLDLPTAYWHEMVLAMEREALPLPARVSLVILGGERVLPERVAAWHHLVPEPVRLVNTYGPTEGTVIATLAHLAPPPTSPRAVGNVPIGGPLPNVDTYVLDGGMGPVGPDVSGELFLGGAGLARGYLGDPAQTAAAFVPDPVGGAAGARLYRTGDQVRWRLGGALEFLGRMDDQVKIRGFRVEPGEVETVLRRHPDVADAVVVVREAEPGVRSLVGYIVPATEAAPPEAELRAFLAEQLPEYMVPARCICIGDLPLTSNGKLDRGALPAPPGAGAPGSAAAPRNRVEEVLVAAYRESLGVEHVGIHDSFFALGGDSIRGIQVLARARREGVRLKLSSLFQHQTVAKLAEAAAPDGGFAPEPDAAAGPFPLTPYQAWFFARQHPVPHHWNMALNLEAGEPLHHARVAAVLNRLAAHHAALRVRFEPGPDGWTQMQGDGSAAAFAQVDLARVPARERAAARMAVAEQVQTSLHLARGPVLRVVLLEHGPGEPQRLLLSAHHMVMDGVSWRILLEDFQTAYRQMGRGEPVRFPARTTSYRHWAERLDGYASSPTLLSELPYWRRAFEGSEPAAVPRPVEGDARSVTVSLEDDATRALLRDVPRALGTQINDALVAGVAWALSRSCGPVPLRLDLEAHGREDLFDDVDLSRTVGCFTAVAPLLLDLSQAARPADALALARDALSALPNRGIGFGVLRYLSRHPDANAARAAWGDADVSFNYLGSFEQTGGGDSLLRYTTASTGAVRHPGNPMAYLLEILAWTVAGRLTVQWTWSPGHYDLDGVRRMAIDHLDFLRRLATADAAFAPVRTDALAGLSAAARDHLHEQFGLSSS